MKKQKYALNLLLILALTGFALWFALKDNYQQVVKCISQMNLLSLVIVLLWGVLFTAVWGFVYYILGRKYTENYTPGKGMLVAFIGSFFSGITPSSTGGQFVQAYIMKKQGIKVSDGASLLWADFIIYQTTMMVYVSILFLLRFAYYSVGIYCQCSCGCGVIYDCVISKLIYQAFAYFSSAINKATYIKESRKNVGFLDFTSD